MRDIINTLENLKSCNHNSNNVLKHAQCSLRSMDLFVQMVSCQKIHTSKYSIKSADEIWQLNTALKKNCKPLLFRKGKKEHICYSSKLIIDTSLTNHFQLCRTVLVTRACNMYILYFLHNNTYHIGELNSEKESTHTQQNKTTTVESNKNCSNNKYTVYRDYLLYGQNVCVHVCFGVIACMYLSVQ